MKEKLLDYFCNNVASMFWSAFIISGGMVFIFYFAHIGYMPEFDLKSAIAIVSAAAITSIFTILLFVFVFIMPAIFWTEGLTKNAKVRNWLEDDNGERSIFKASVSFALSIVSVYVFFALVVYDWRASVFYAVFASILVGALFRKVFSCQGRELVEETVKFLALSLIVSGVAILPLYSFLSLFESTEITSKGGPIFVGIPSAIFIVFSNIMVIAKPKKWKGLPYYFGVGFLCFFIVFSSFEKFYRIPERTMEVYKFGAIETKIIIFDEVGCKIVSKVIGVDSYENKSVCDLQGARILSRLGKNMYIQFENEKFSVANKHVMSWSVQEETVSNK